MSYRMAVAGLRFELTEDEAYELWEDWPEQLRTGSHRSTFILWDLDPNGRRCSPMVCRRVASKSS